MKKEQEKVEFRYYEVPQNFPVIALLGERWATIYGTDAMHFHNYMEIGYCYEGEGIMHFGNTERAYGPGTITLIPKNLPHHTTGAGDGYNKWEYLFVDSEKILRKIYQDRPGYPERLQERLDRRMFAVTAQEHPEVYKLLSLIFEEMRQKGEFYKDTVMALLLSLLLKIIHLNSDHNIQEQKNINDGNLDSILEVLEYINLNYARDINVEELAQVSHMSLTHFRRVFLRYMDVAPSEYVNLVRIQKACELLSKNHEGLSEVAAKVGFPVLSTFIRNFKKIVGCPPNQWRNREQDKGDQINNFSVSIKRGW